MMLLRFCADSQSTRAEHSKKTRRNNHEIRIQPNKKRMARNQKQKGGKIRMETTKVRKTPIGEIGKKQRKVTIADEVEIETQYRIEPPLTAEQLARCWLDPSEYERTIRERPKAIIGSRKESLSSKSIEVLKKWVKPEAIEHGIVKFFSDDSFQWAMAKPIILRKFNLTNLTINSKQRKINQIKIKSRQPLYDEKAHERRVRNILHAVKVHYPHIYFDHEECFTSGICPVGLKETLRKLAEETHGKVMKSD